MSNFIIDDTISKKVRDEISERVKERIKQSTSEISERKTIIEKRQDFFEGRHHKWTNVIGQGIKQQQGHIQVVINYIGKFCQKLVWILTNFPAKIKIVAEDEANDIEVSRSEALEEAIRKTFRDNKFQTIILEKLAVNQVRDGDFIFDCRVVEDKNNGGKKIVISPIEDLLKVSVGWDDASGTSFSFVSFSDQWSIDKIKREFDYEAEPISEKENQAESKGSHLNDQYGILSSPSGTDTRVPSGKSAIPKANIEDYWGYEVLATKDDKVSKVRVVNLVFINKELVQFVVTSYKKIPRFIGHSFMVAGKPWSKGFIDDLVDPQVELNDRSGEEGDLIRVGSHMKFLVVNMPDFDPSSIKPGSGQVIFLEGEDVDFRPLQMSISPFPSESYIDRTTDHLFNLGLPKIALAAGTAPYTGRVAAIQYQPVADITQNLRMKWEVVLTDLISTIQQYFIDYFPETHQFMRESIYNPDSKTYEDGELIIRDVEFDWENILPLSRSDKVVDASTMRDRNAISLATYLEITGFKDPQKEIKKLKKEMADEDLVATMTKFQELSSGAVNAQIDAAQKVRAAEENNAETMGTMQELATKANTPTRAPILSAEQNEGRRGISTSTGTPTGQTATQKGAVVQMGQNLNAQAGV